MISRLLTTSSFNVDADANASKTSAGRRLANNSNSFLNPSNPASGLLERSTSSHLEPPTAPSKIASDCLAFSKTSEVKGSPFAS